MVVVVHSKNLQKEKQKKYTIYPIVFSLQGSKCINRLITGASRLSLITFYQLYHQTKQYSNFEKFYYILE